MKVFAKALKSFNQKALLSTYRLRNQAFLTVFAQEIEELQSKKGLVRKPLSNRGPLPAEDHAPTAPRQTLRDVNLRHGIDPDADDRLKYAGPCPGIAPTTLGRLLESSKAFPVSAARQEMLEGRRELSRPESLVVDDEILQIAQEVKKPFTFADLGRRHIRPLVETPKAEVHLVNPTEVAVILKDTFGGKYEYDVMVNNVTFDIYQSKDAIKAGCPVTVQTPLPYVGMFTLFKEEMLTELAKSSGLSAETIKFIGDHPPSSHDRHVVWLMASGLQKVAKIEKRVTVIDAELYEYVTHAFSF